MATALGVPVIPLAKTQNLLELVIFYKYQLDQYFNK